MNNKQVQKFMEQRHPELTTSALDTPENWVSLDFVDNRIVVTIPDLSEVMQTQKFQELLQTSPEKIGLADSREFVPEVSLRLPLQTNEAIWRCLMLYDWNQEKERVRQDLSSTDDPELKKFLRLGWPYYYPLNPDYIENDYLTVHNDGWRGEIVCRWSNPATGSFRQTGLLAVPKNRVLWKHSFGWYFYRHLKTIPTFIVNYSDYLIGKSRYQTIQQLDDDLHEGSCVITRTREQTQRLCSQLGITENQAVMINAFEDDIKPEDLHYSIELFQYCTSVLYSFTGDPTVCGWDQYTGLGKLNRHLIFPIRHTNPIDE